MHFMNAALTKQIHSANSANYHAKMSVYNSNQNNIILIALFVPSVVQYSIQVNFF